MQLAMNSLHHTICLQVIGRCSAGLDAEELVEFRPQL